MEPLRNASRIPGDLPWLNGDRLLWWPELEAGYYPVKTGSTPYDTAYFERFKMQAATPMGRALMKARVDFVARHVKGPIVDVGIGSGAFIELWNRTQRGGGAWGYDINPAAVDWLGKNRAFVDPYLLRPDVITLWDVLEHIPDFSRLLASAQKFVFVSLPIFVDCEHVLRSKHFRKDEHYWYFTFNGLIRMFESFGFEVFDYNNAETAIGREDIGSFAFRRKGP